MTAEEISSLLPGTLLLVVYGNGTQLARLRQVTCKGIEVDRFVSSYGGSWHASPGTIQASKVIGFPERNDPRVRASQVRILETIGRIR